MRKYISIAVDGPSGAGKSTLSRRAAEQFHLLYVDTGAIYRTVGLAAFRRGISLYDADGVASILPHLRIELLHATDGLQHMYLNGEDITQEIRLPKISLYASAVSAFPSVRTFLLDMQRNLAKKQDVIMDGRDIGTVVLPGADLKIFLTATPEDRAMRRFEELKQKGISADFEDVLRDILLRDDNDSKRASSPLRKAADAVLLDTTGLSFDEGYAALSSVLRERLDL